MLQFYAYRLAVRPGFSLLHTGGKLFQQYVVDAYVKTEGSRLQFLRYNQSSLRVEQYQRLIDHIANRAAHDNVQPGRTVILPSTFIGSPRNMQQNFQDAMAIVRKYGKPDLFITFTCNPQWPEIANNIQEGQKVEHRPDLIVRVFHLKLKSLITDLKNNCVLGTPVAHVHVCEFQKRGLPHAHILVILRSEDKFRNREDIDKAVSAELPDPVKCPRLHAIVTRSMIHGPCGALNP